jgi:hypothetical protein
LLPPYVTECAQDCGDNLILITYPDIFQMFFNYPDTLGNILNFNKVGEPFAVTPYGHVVSNDCCYENDYNYETLGNDFMECLGKLHMTGYDFFYITCEEFGKYREYFQNTQPVRNVLAKVLWYGNPGSVVYDSFVPSTCTFDIPIPELHELTINIVNPDGSPVDFNDQDHSFTLEIVELFGEPDETNISSRINQSVIVRKV